jgi:FMN phosphatase YigB (HAD superfamily)
MLAELPQRKVIFTNCREREASEALAALGIASHFERIFGADFLTDSCKVTCLPAALLTLSLQPDLEAFELLLCALGVSGEEIVFFEDSLKNLQRGHSLGMRTVLIEGMTSKEETDGALTGGEAFPGYVHVAVSTLTDGGRELRIKYPELFAPAATNERECVEG